MFAQFSPAAYPAISRMTLPQLAKASAIYGLGFFILFALFALLYRHAYNKREALGLTPVEAFDARAYLGHHVVSAAVGLVAVAVALLAPLTYAPLSPMSFGLMGPAHWWFGTRADRRRQILTGAVATPRSAHAD
jgi:sterol desaturase/sphingolipid hydroxylase (fatty acid hydroxylase superfamily)